MSCLNHIKKSFLLAHSVIFSFFFRDAFPVEHLNLNMAGIRFRRWKEHSRLSRSITSSLLSVGSEL